MKFDSVIPSAIETTWKTCTAPALMADDRDSVEERAHTETLVTTPVVQNILRHVMRKVADTQTNAETELGVGLMLMLRIGWDLREYMQTRYADAAELERIIPDAELEALYREMKGTIQQ